MIELQKLSNVFYEIANINNELNNKSRALTLYEQSLYFDFKKLGDEFDIEDF